MENITWGIELEHALLGRFTHKPFHAEPVIEHMTGLGFHVEPEFHRNVIELISPILSSPVNAFEYLQTTDKALADYCYQFDIEIGRSGSDKYNHWSAIEVTPFTRYQSMQAYYRDVLLRNYIFGMHVHIGNSERPLNLINGLREFIPYLIAASANSPYWSGRDTQLASYRSIVFMQMPLSGLPGYFTDFTQHNVDTDLIKRWHDLRIHQTYNTIEIRCLDMQQNLQWTQALFSLVYVIVAFIQQYPYKQRSDENLTEERWLAAMNGREYGAIAGGPYGLGSYNSISSALMEHAHGLPLDQQAVLRAFLFDYEGGAVAQRKEAIL